MYIARLIYENLVAKQKIPPHKEAADGSDDHFSNFELYEGVGADAKFVLTSEKDIQEIFYGGVKPPHMWWENSKSI